MKLVFALGNPEQRYQNTRHNVGFIVADALIDGLNASWKLSSKHKAMLAEIGSGEDKLIIAKPTTYYNLVGECYQSLASYYDIAKSDCLVVHDDLALDFGVIRVRVGGSGGGSNGIRNLNAHGGNDTLRLRIGIKNELADQIDSADFVLSNFSRSEVEHMPQLIEQSLEIIDKFATDQIETTTYQV